MGLKALGVSLAIGLTLLLGLQLVNTIQGLLQSVMQVAVILLVVYVIYELVSGWRRGRTV